MNKKLINENGQNKDKNSILVKFKGWGSSAISARIARKEVFEEFFSEGQVIWKMECINNLMWTPSEYDIYKLFLAEPEKYENQIEAQKKDYASCKVKYLALRREEPAQELEEYEILLSDFQPHVSRKKYEELLKELEGKTPEEKKEIIIEEMEELTAAMSYY